MNGLGKIWKSAKAMFALLVLIVCAVIAWHGVMSAAFAACISSITSVFLWVHSNSEIAAMSPNNVTQEVIDSVKNSIKGDV